MPTQIRRPQVTRTTGAQETVKVLRSYRHHGLWLRWLDFSLGAQSYFLLHVLKFSRLADAQAQAIDPDFTDLVVEYAMGGMENGE